MRSIEIVEAGPDEIALFNRLGWRLLPLLVLLFLVAFIDRQNVGFAKLQMVSDLNLSEAAYGFGASLFFIGYVIFEIPSCLALNRFGARIWLARLMLSWGVVTVLLAFTSSKEMFYVLRFLLGVAEAGFYPGVVFYIREWFPEPYRVRMLGYFTLGSSLGNMLGGLFNGILLDFEGVLGLAGWQWVFLGSGMPAILLAFVALGFLPSSPAKTAILTDKERVVLAAAHARRPSEVDGHGNPLSVLWDPRVLGFGGIYVLYVIAFYEATYWLPTVVHEFGVSSTMNGVLNMIPWGIGNVGLLLIPRILVNDRITLSATAAITAMGALCFLAGVLVQDVSLRFIALAIGGPCIAVLNPCFWIFPSRMFAGARAAASIAAINSIGNFGGFVAQNLAPWVEQLTGTVVGPMLVPAFCLAVLSVLAIIGLMLSPRSV
ncbi:MULTISPECIES: MFS transporter [unclassified Bradyrhizobium]